MREKEEMGINSILLIWCHRLTVLSYWVGFDRNAVFAIRLWGLLDLRKV